MLAASTYLLLHLPNPKYHLGLGSCTPRSWRPWWVLYTLWVGMSSHGVQWGHFFFLSSNKHNTWIRWKFFLEILLESIQTRHSLMGVGSGRMWTFPKEESTTWFSKLVSRAKVSSFIFFWTPLPKSKLARERKSTQPRGRFVFAFPLGSSCQFNLLQNTLSDEHAWKCVLSVIREITLNTIICRHTLN